MKAFFAAGLLSLLCGSARSSSLPLISADQAFGTLYTMGNATKTQIPGVGYRVNLNAQGSSFGINLTGNTNWSSATHLIVKLKNTGSSTEFVFIGIDSTSGGNGHWLFSNTSIPAGQVVTLAMPLLPPDPHLMRWPSLPDTSMIQTLSAGSIALDNSYRVRLANFEDQGPMSLELYQISTQTIEPNVTHFVDAYGQQDINFPTKVTSDSQLQAQAMSDALLSGFYPFSNDSYGGVAGTGSGATGKWSTAKQNGKWYILDPSGNRFFSTGIVSAGWSTASFVDDRLSMFVPGALPDPNGPFGSHFAIHDNPETGQSVRAFNFYSSNLQRKFGSNWEVEANNNIARRLRTWGFNTIGPLAGLTGNNGMVTAPVFPVMGAFQRINCLDGMIMPDVYDPAWATAVQSTLAKNVLPLIGDNSNMGFFLDNELPWALGPTTGNKDFLLPFSVLSAAPTAPAKVRFVNNLTLQYRTITNLNRSWQTNFASWTALLNNRTFNPSNVTLTMNRDMRLFTSQFATQYFSTVRAKLAPLNYKGLYLGCRFLYYTSEVLAVAKRYSDVISFNAYCTNPAEYRADLKNVDCPVMISEFGFGASDLGRVSGYVPNIAVESDRVSIYQDYIAEAMTWNNLVGAHYYKWEDDPPSGRLWDGECFDLGLVSITDNPYPQMVAAVQQANTNFMNRLLIP